MLAERVEEYGNYAFADYCTDALLLEHCIALVLEHCITLLLEHCIALMLEYCIALLRMKNVIISDDMIVQNLS